MKKLLCFLLTALLLLSVCGGALADGTADTLALLTSQRRGAGSEGEATVREEVSKVFADLGYTVATQEFSGVTVNVGTEYTAQNLIAVRKADQDADNASILVVSAHLDSIATTVGANDNASGCAAVIEIAKAVAALPSAIELRFILFSGEEDGLLGSTAYAEALTEDEKARMIGDLEIDMIGNRYQKGWLAATSNGESNALTDLLQLSAAMLGMEAPTVRQETASDHTPFHLVGVPAVLFMQNGDGYENHALADDLTILNMDKVNEGIALACQAVKTAMNGGMTPTKASAVGCMGTYAVMEKDMTLATIQRIFGVPLTLVSSGNDGFLAEEYTAQVRWLESETPCETHFLMTDGKLGEAWFAPQETTAEDFTALLTGLLGTPDITEDDGLTWFDKVYHKAYMLQTEPLQLHIGYFKDKSDQVKYELDYYGKFNTAVLDSRMQRLWDDIISKVIPEEYRTLLGSITLYSDGWHEEMGRTEPESDTENARMSLKLDAEDAFDQNGAYRHFIKTVSTVVHEFFHVMCENAGQVTIGEEGSIRGYYDVCKYNDDSYEALFYGAFYPAGTVEHYTTLYTDDAYVNVYASTGLGEDLAESFTHFVFLPKQEGTTVAQQKVNFFYQFDELVALRAHIREAFDLGE